MRKLSRLTIAALLLAIVASPVWAQDAEKKKGKGKKGKQSANPVVALLKKAEITTEQQPKIDAIAKEFGPKLAAIDKKQADILTADQKKAEAEAKKSNRESGAKGPEAQKAVMDALSLTSDQKAAMGEIRKEKSKLLGQLREKLKDVLTEEQLAKLPQLKERSGKQGKGKKKKAA